MTSSQRFFIASLAASVVASIIWTKATDTNDPAIIKPDATNSATPEAVETNKPIKLQSTAKTIEPPFPVYVIPEVVVVRTPAGPIAFAPEFHVQELAKKFGAVRITNVIVYNK